MHSVTQEFKPCEAYSGSYISLHYFGNLHLPLHGYNYYGYALIYNYTR